MREIVHLQAGQCGNQIGAKVSCVCFNAKFGRFKVGTSVDICLSRFLSL